MSLTWRRPSSRSAASTGAVIPAQRLRRCRERCSPSFTASLEGWATNAPRRSFETPRKRAAPQDDVWDRTKGETMFEKGLLANKRILVTGGGSGLGAAMGRRFAELGAELIICGRRVELLEQAASAMRRNLGATVSIARCDIRDGAAVDAMMDEVFGTAPIDVLVNNA